MSKNRDAITLYKKGKAVIDKDVLVVKPFVDIMQGYEVHPVSGSEKYKAWKWLKKATEIDPNNADIWYYRGLACEGLYDYHEAIECFDKGITMHPNNAKLWMKKGEMLAALGRVDEAIKCHSKATELDPKNPEVWFHKGSVLRHKGSVLRHKGKDDDAEKCFAKAAKIDPRYKHAWSWTTPIGSLS